MVDLILRGAMVVTPGGTTIADIAIRRGRIDAVGDLRGRSALREIDCAGKHVLPGAIDTQVHFREPGMEHKEDLESGSRAALMGGVTTYFEMPNTRPTTSTGDALADKLRRATGRSWVNFAFFVGATTDNIEALGHLEMLPGTPGVKIFMGSSTGSLLVQKDEDVRRVLQNGVRPCSVHSEDEPRLRARQALISAEPHVREHPFLRDAEAARLCTERLLALSAETGRPVHVLHISSADELPLLRAAKDAGQPVTCEATPQHLMLNAELYETLGSHLQMNPPVRDESHRSAIFAAWQGGLFDVIGSDHAPHTLGEKAQPYPKSPSGMPGVQTLLPVMLTLVHDGAMSLERLVQMTSARPAELFGIRDRGRIEPGCWADLVVLDPNEPFTVGEDWLQSKAGWSPYTGRTLYGRPERVIVNGRMVVEDGEIADTPAGRIVEFEWK
ncbi:MAG: dihydroorotase [Chthonomonas sp.]|nr:dihydroorotase [Chthonomonas sp.]